MRALIDCDVLLDVALERSAFLTDSVGVLGWAELHTGAGWVAWHSLANIHYIAGRLRGSRVARDFLGEILAFLEVPAVDQVAARQALALPLADYEDALQVAAALGASVDVIVTRNLADYRRSPVPALAPAEFLKRVRP
ncbi:MAG: PIN domain-containing protein [Opitutaceae bacterium]|nr:PIN domain-containing protein [Opitutaceae bacterium]